MQGLSNIYIYALKEDDGKKHAPFFISYSRAREYNAKGYGIFFAVHEMYNDVRCKDNVKKLRAWFVDIDYGEKEDMYNSLMSAPLEPSLIIETKRGYHCYWLADETATVENFQKIEQMLIDKYGGDNNVKDFARIMRLPTYYHTKDKDDKFKIQIVHFKKKKYSEAKMMLAFSKYEKKQKRRYVNREVNVKEFKSDEDIVKFFKVPPMGKNTGRHGFIMTKIGQMKHLGFTAQERSNIVWAINRNFAVELPKDEVESMIRTT